MSAAPTMSTVSQADLRRLLLHRLAAEEAQQLEERLLSEEGLAERVQDEENDLLDDYARGRLTADERAAVEQYLLIGAAQQQRVEFAQALARIPRERGTRSRTSWRWAVPLGALLAAAVATVVLVPLFRPGGDLGPQAAPLTVTLLAETARGATERTLRIGPGVKQIRLQLETPNPDPAMRYRLRIAAADGRSVLTAEHLSPRRAGAYQFVETVIPARAIGPGARRLTLTAEAPAAPASEAYTWQLRATRD